MRRSWPVERRIWERSPCASQNLRQQFTKRQQQHEGRHHTQSLKTLFIDTVWGRLESGGTGRHMPTKYKKTKKKQSEAHFTFCSHFHNSSLQPSSAPLLSLRINNTISMINSQCVVWEWRIYWQLWPVFSEFASNLYLHIDIPFMLFYENTFMTLNIASLQWPNRSAIRFVHHVQLVVFNTTMCCCCRSYTCNISPVTLTSTETIDQLN